MSRLDLTHRAIEQLFQLSSLIKNRRRQLAERVGLTEAQWRVLEGIATEHFMPSLFAERQQSSRAAVSKMLRQLVDLRLIRQVSNSGEDGRQRRYELSSKGQRIIERLRGLREEAIEAVWTSLPKAGLLAFTEFNEELIDRLGAYADQESKSTIPNAK